MKRAFEIVCVVAIVAALASSSMANGLINGVPNWDQPSNDGIAGYPDWCAPTSGAMVVGYWEDQFSLTGVADRQVSPASPAYPANPGTWMQGLYHDSTIEMGWYMDTGNWRTSGGSYPPGTGGTAFVPDDIGPGIVSYTATAWNDPGGLSKSAFVSASFTNDTNRNQVMWNNYMGEIDAGRPVISTFDTWVGSQQGTTTVNGQTVHLYGFGAGTPHTVTGVGYIDPTPASFNGDEQIIAQDNWPTTPQYVAVPVDANWRLNDYMTVSISSNNLITNGDFSAGNSGFSSDLQYSPGNVHPEGTYDISTNPNLSHPTGISYGDHTTGMGLMFVGNGSTGSTEVAWQQQVAVIPEQEYSLSFWLSDWSGPGHPAAVLQVYINDLAVGAPVSTSPENGGVWEPHSFVWMSGETETSALISLVNPSTGVGGNDFALDDLEFRFVPEPTTLSLLALGGLAVLRRRRKR